MIETRGLKKGFWTRSGVVEAVRGLDLSVGRGEVFGLLGPNGAGKTTTLRMLATLLVPDGGEAAVAGHDLLGDPGGVRERIGYVGQAGGADGAATGRENLVLQGRLFGLGRTRAREGAARLIDALELGPFADRLAKTYSGGQRRRLDLALGLMHEPPVLFLDEPTAGLDPQSRARLWDEVRRLAKNGTTVFLTTHYLEEADVLCDRLAIIDEGCVVAEGTPEELKRRLEGDVITLRLDERDGELARARELLETRPFVREIEVAEKGLRLYVERGEEALPNVLHALNHASVGLRTVALSRPTLDDVFLRQTGRSLREAEGERIAR